MNINDAFPSKTLKASDMQGKDVRLSIADVTMEKLGDDMRPCISFHGTPKTLVLNKTNSLAIAEAYGEHTDAWRGQPIILFAAKVQYQGKIVDGIRVKVPPLGASAAPPQQQRQSAPAQQQQRQAPPPQNTIGDDEIPF